MHEHDYDSDEEENIEDLYDEDDADGDDDEHDHDHDRDHGDAVLAGDGDAADDATTDGDDESATEESDEDEDEDEDEDAEGEGDGEGELDGDGEGDEDGDGDDDDDDDEQSLDLGLMEEAAPPPSEPDSSNDSRMATSSPQGPTSPARPRSLSPARRRRLAIAFPLANMPRTFTVEAICAIPHPVPTHALAASACMTHLLTGSDDGYVRDYDVFAAVNSKNFLTAPQRHHAGVVEGLMKSGQLRFWWENPPYIDGKAGAHAEEDHGPAPVYSLAMHSDALWALAGTNAGTINLFTLRHEPGRLCHVMNGHHRSPVSALCLDYDEKGFFSAGWDGVAIQWDLNTGQNVRNFTAHNAQLTSIGLRPMAPYYNPEPTPIYHSSQSQGNTTQSQSQPDSQSMDVDAPTNTSDADPANLLPKLEDTSQLLTMESDARSDASFDPLFDDVPEDSAPAPPVESKLAMPGSAQAQVQPPFVSRDAAAPTIAPPKGAPPLFDTTSFQTYSSDILMTAFIDGQVILWDRRAQTNGRGVGRLWMNEKTPPWCLSASWSADGAQIYAGRRNGTVDVWDVRVLGQSGPANTPRLLKTLRNPASSGVVSCVVPFPDCRHIACASIDNIRLWNIADTVEDSISKNRSGVQFRIIPGHHGGYISQMLVDSGCRFLVSASSNRGLHGDSTRTVFVHDIKRVE